MIHDLMFKKQHTLLTYRYQARTHPSQQKKYLFTFSQKIFLYFTELQKLHLHILCINKLMEMQLKKCHSFKNSNAKYCLRSSFIALYLTHGITEYIFK